MFANAIESNPAPNAVIFGGAFFIALLVYSVAMLITMEFDLSEKWYTPLLISVVISVVGWAFVFNNRIEDNYPISVLYWSLGFYAFGIILTTVLLLLSEV